MHTQKLIPACLCKCDGELAIVTVSGIIAFLEFTPMGETWQVSLILKKQGDEAYQVRRDFGTMSATLNPPILTPKVFVFLDGNQVKASVTIHRKEYSANLRSAEWQSLCRAAPRPAA